MGLLASACGAFQGDPTASDANRHQASERMGNSVTDASIPINQRFRSLDEYLAHLEMTQAPIDGAWYKQVSPGVYQLQTGNLRVLGADDARGADGKQLFTRQELEKKFGFSK